MLTPLYKVDAGPYPSPGLQRIETMDKLHAYTPTVARLLLSALFILGGLGKLADVQGFGGYLAMGGLPAFLAWPAVLFEIAVGVAMILGFQTRIMALLAAGFCIVTALLYHNNFADQTQMVMFLKNLGLAGGFLLLTYTGPGKLAVSNA